MDTDRRLNAHEADEALRQLFQEVGHVQAPEGLDARILARIAVAQRPALGTEAPLVPRWAWVAAALFIAALCWVLFSTPVEDARAVLPALPRPTGLAGALGWLRSPWVLFAMALATVLFAAESFGDQVRLVRIRSGHGR